MHIILELDESPCAAQIHRLDYCLLPRDPPSITGLEISPPNILLQRKQAPGGATL